MGLPPANRVDHHPVIVLQADTAWDKDRIEDELQAIGSTAEDSPWETREDHPYHRYALGKSRGDIATVEEYFQEGETPVRFSIRRVSFLRWTEAERLEGESEPAARNYILRHSLAGVTGYEDLELDWRDDTLTAKGMSQLREAIGDYNFQELGRQAVWCNRALTVTEKKL